jgi:hypothetical protein
MTEENTPNGSAPPPAQNFANHVWEETQNGRVCRGCKLPWSEVFGEGSRPCYQNEHSERTRIEMENAREWLWTTIADAASS